MKISVRTGSPEGVKGPLLVVATRETKGRVPAALRELDRCYGGLIGRLIRGGEYHGTLGDSVMAYPDRGATRVLLVAVGGNDWDAGNAIRRAAATAARRALDAGVRRMVVQIGMDCRGDLADEAVGQSVAEGVCQGGWRFSEFKQDGKDESGIAAVSLLASSAEERVGLERGSALGYAIGAGQSFARRLQALPGNVCTPTYLGETAEKMGREHGFAVTVYDEERIKRMRMGALLAVASGSVEKPRLIVLEYRGGKGPPVCLVGKGVTFDTGGISLKPGPNMEEMKFDMSGAAAVLGTFEALGRIKPRCNVVGVIPSTDNMPSGSAVKPGDIVRSHSGKTIEIINTDAEGRLILADALSFARRFKPNCVLDAATLTGAVVIALGHHASGVMGNDGDLVHEVAAAGERAGERCWELPLWDVYREALKSDYADIKNLGDRSASSITAGWFLREFVGDIPWAHLDIAGTAYGNNDQPHMAKGPTGVGVRLFTQFILGRAN